MCSVLDSGVRDLAFQPTFSRGVDMNQDNKRNPEPADQGVIARLGAALADWSEKWFPDAYVFAAIAVVIVCVAALAMGRTPSEISVDFGKSFWNLIPFTMQMAFVVIGGYIVAVSAPVRKVIDAHVPQRSEHDRSQPRTVESLRGALIAGLFGFGVDQRQL